MLAALAILAVCSVYVLAQTPTPTPQLPGTAMGAANISTVNFINIAQSSSPIPTPTPTPTPPPGSSTTPVAFGVMPYATINLTPNPPIGQQSFTEQIPNEDGSGYTSVKVTFTPNLIAKKVTGGGVVLLEYDHSVSTMPCGYTWQNGAQNSLNGNTSWMDPSNGVSYYSGTLIADANDNGTVIGSIPILLPVTGIAQEFTNPYEDFSQPTYWPAGSRDPVQMSIPPGTVETENVTDTGQPYGFVETNPSSVTATSVTNAGTAFGNYTTGIVFSVNGFFGYLSYYYSDGSVFGVAWPSGFGTPQEALAPLGALFPSSLLFQAVSGRFELVSPSGLHVMTSVQNTVGGAYYYLLDDGPIAATLGPGGSFGGMNDGGRYLYGTGWADLSGPLQPIAGLQPSGSSQGAGTAMAINVNYDILGQKSGGAYALYTWTVTGPPTTSQPAGPGSYSENLLNLTAPTFTTPTGWQVVSLAASVSNSRMLVGQIQQVSDASGNTLPTSQQIVAPALFVPAALLVDANRDGVIDANDVGATSAAAPFTFWVNDGVDGFSTARGEPTVQEDLDPDPTTGAIPNYQQDSITCTRDLENFARLWLYTTGLNNAISSGHIIVGLEWHSNTGDAINGWGADDGAPAINIYAAAPKDGTAVNTGGADYLTDPNTAIDQASNEFQIMLGTVAKGEPFYFPTSELTSLTNTNPTAYFLFESAARGTGRLVMTFNTFSNGTYTKIGEGGWVYMNLKETQELYERWTVGDGPPLGRTTAGGGGAPSPTAQIKQLGLPAGATALQYSSTTVGLSVPSDPTGNDYILFVHGWNLAPWEKDAFAATMLKRLYWQGYKGKFGVFQWPTTYGNISLGSINSDFFNNTQKTPDYDDGEFTGWRSAQPLEKLLVQLNGQYGSNVFVLAHSMGNVVTGEALRIAGQQRLSLVKTYVATQAAVPGHCYDPTLSGTNLLLFGGINTLLTPNIYNSWMVPAQPAMGSSASFYNVNDFALSFWNLDEILKPDDRTRLGGYDYFYRSPDFTTVQDLFCKSIQITNVTQLHLGDANNVQDRYEIMAYSAQPRSKALGEAPNTAGFTSFVLQTPGFWPEDTLYQWNGAYSAHPWHSAEFLFTNADQQNY
jgi:hypothetical protein